jgi:hypothetical protein
MSRELCILLMVVGLLEDGTGELCVLARPYCKRVQCEYIFRSAIGDSILFVIFSERQRRAIATVEICRLYRSLIAAINPYSAEE